MKQQLKLQNKEKYEKTKDKNVQTVIETDTDLTTDEVNIELAERKVTTIKEEKIVDGEEKTVIDIDESKDIQKVSYPRPDKIYNERTEGLTVETVDEEEENEETSEPVSQPKVVFIQIEAPERKQFFPESFDSVELADSQDLEPSVEFTVEENETGEFIKQVQETEFTEIFEQVSGSFLLFSEERFLEEENNGGEYRKEEYEEDSLQILFEENDEDYDVDLDESDLDFILEDGFDVSSDFQSVSSIAESLEDFDGLEQHGFVSNGVLKAEYNSTENSKGVSERVIVSLDNFGEYDSVRGSEVVEYLGSNTALDATVAEIPYFSENSGMSWESGWNSFDMVLQMGDMDFQNMEYMISDIGEKRDSPAKQSINSDFDSSKVLEFRESQEWSNHDGGYEASQETIDAWEEKYGEGIMELDDIERGIYAAIVEGNEFRGSDLDFTEMDLENGELLQEVYLERENYLQEFTPEINGKGLSTALS